MTPITPIIKLVADYYKWDPKILLSKRKLDGVVTARRMIAWLAREHLKFSWKTIAYCLKIKSHASVYSAHATIKKRMKTDQKLKQQGELLLGRLKAMEEKV